MTDSDTHRSRAAEIIEKITALLDETHLAQLIDEPIDAAVETFACRVERPDSHRQFHDVISDFVFHIHQNSTACPQELPRSQARDEGVALLEQAYEGTHANGYHAALLDANDASQAGMQVVLSRLAEIFKSRQRRNHRQWVFAHCIDPGDWQTKCDIAATLLDRCRLLLPAESCPQNPEQFVDHIPDLFDTVLSTEQLEQQALSASFASHA